MKTVARISCKQYYEPYQASSNPEIADITAVHIGGDSKNQYLRTSIRVKMENKNACEEYQKLLCECLKKSM